MSVLLLLTPSWAQPGTGLYHVIASIKESGLPVTKEAHEAFINSLPPQFGDYPNHTDIAPSALFTALFAIFTIANLYIFIKNYVRGQRFWISFGLASYTLCKMIGLAVRIAAAKDDTRVTLQVVSTALTQVPTIYLNTLNLILAHRIFTWRHPETGASVVFNIQMIQCYVVVIGVITMALCGQIIPIYNFMTPKHASMCKKVSEAASILQTLYAGCSFLLIGLAYTFAPGTIDHRVFRMPKKILREHLPHTFQPNWVESTNFWYFPAKGSQQIVYKGDPEGLDKAIRVIPSDQEPASGLVYSRNPKIHNGPKISAGVAIVLTTTAALAIGGAIRSAVIFSNEPRGGAPGKSMPIINHSYMFYIFYCAVEILINTVYLIGRIDLRFYIPDMPRKGPPPVGYAEDRLQQHNSVDKDDPLHVEKTVSPTAA